MRRQRDIPWKWLWQGAFGLLFGLGGIAASEAFTLKAGNVITLVRERTVVVEIEQEGEYRLGTRGQYDPACLLSNTQEGVFATDDNSGEGKNCRFDLRLARGLYRLEVQNTTKPLNVYLERYQDEGSDEVLTIGKEHLSTLRAGMGRTFEVEIPERRHISFTVRGATAFQCRLLDSQGWPTALQGKATVNDGWLDGTNRIRQCSLAGVVEPGRYRLSVYGERSTPNLQGQGTDEAKLSLFAGEERLSLSRSFRVRAAYQTTQRYEIRLKPQTEGKPIRFFLHAKAAHRGWSIELQQKDLLSSEGTGVRSCNPWRRSTKEAFSCVLTAEMQPGKRYVLSFSGNLLRPIRTTTMLFPIGQELTLDRPQWALIEPGIALEQDITLAEKRSVEVAVSSPIQTCQVQVFRPKLGRYEPLYTHAIPLGNLAYTDSVKADTGFWWQWLRLPADGRLRIEVESGTALTLLVASETTRWKAEIKSTDAKEPLVFQQTLPAGLYRVSILHPTRAAMVASFKASLQTLKPTEDSVPRPLSCRFKQDFGPGKYKLLVPPTGQREVLLVGWRLQGIQSILREPEDIASQVTESSSEPLGETPPQAILPFSTPLHTDLAPAQTKTFLFRVPRLGLLRIASSGLLPLRCALQTKDDPSLFAVAENGAGGNCRIARLLTPGVYRLLVQPTQGSSGRTSFSASFSPAPRLPSSPRSSASSTLQPGQPIHTLLRNLASFPVHHSPPPSGPRDALFDFFSPDGLVAFQLRSHDGLWPVATTVAHQWQGAIPALSHAFFWQTDKPLRLRATFLPLHPTTYMDHFRPTPSLAKVDEISYRIPLHGSFSHQLSPLGYDIALFDTQSTTGLRIHLSEGIQGRLTDAADRFVADIGMAATPTEVSLPKGSYKLFLRHKMSLANQSYTIRLEPHTIAPGSRLWRDVPSEIRIDVRSKAQVTLTTQGNPDLWCSLQTLDRHEIASNDDASPRDWNCRISELLPAGTYLFKIEGQGGGAWISAEATELEKDQAFAAFEPKDTSAKPQTLQGDLGPKSIHGFRFDLKESSLFRIYAMASVRSELRCVLEAFDPKARLALPQHDTCNLLSFLPAGSYRFRVQNLSSVQKRGLSVYASVRPALALSLEQPLPLQIHPSTLTFLRFRITQPGFYTLASPHLTGLQCRIAPAHGYFENHSCRKKFSFQEGEYILWLSRSIGRRKFKIPSLSTTIALKEASVSFGIPFPLALPAQATQNLQLLVESKRLVQIDIMGEDPRPWGCQIGPVIGRPLPDAPADLRCRIYALLDRGKHTLSLWKPQGHANEGPTQAKILIQTLRPWGMIARLPLASWRSIQYEETSLLRPHQGKTWLLNLPSFGVPVSPFGMASHVTLKGDGIALLLSPSGEIKAVCEASSPLPRTCAWSLPNAAHESQILLLAGQAPLASHIQIRPTARHPAPDALAVGQAFEWPALDFQGLLHLPLQGSAPASLLAQGSGLSCVVRYPGGRFSEGCSQTVALQDKPSLEIHTTGKPGRIALFAKGQKTASLWNHPIPDPKAPLHSPSIPVVRLSHEIALSPTSPWFRLIQLKDGFVSFRALSGHVVCALGPLGKAPITVVTGRRGCTIQRPLAAGQYWIAVRGFAKESFQTRARLVLGPIEIALKEGRSPEFLLGSKNDLWATFVLTASQKIGFGASAHHEDLSCTLFSSEGRILGSSCKKYQPLAPGRYVVRVSLRAGASPTSVSLVLRGLNPPPTSAPDDFLKKMMGSD